jgi:hypothetical protein
MVWMANPAKVVRFRPKRELVKRETAEAIEGQLLLYPDADLPAQPRAAILNALHRVTHPDDTNGIWPGGFTMISREQTAVIWDAIRKLPGSERPEKVRHAFDLILLNLNWNTGEVMLTRDEMAAKMECSPANVSRVMGTLERMGVIRRERRRVEGMQGRGMAVYVINPHVAWNGSLDARKQQAKDVDQPQLKLVQAGTEED